jgi:tetratricopeptide (TPR) repeat protein
LWLRLRAVFVIALLFAALSWALPDAVPEARANGNVSADEPAPAPQVKKTVRKAPVRRPRPKAKKAPQKPAAAKAKTPPKPTSLERGIALMDEGRYGQAYPWLRKAVQEERRNPSAWYWYGLYHDAVGQYQQAQFFYVKALEQDPAFPLLSRVVTYPDDGGRKALWDPLRPARLYPVETGYGDIRAVPPGSPEGAVLPVRPPADPEAPRVPIYIPPEPDFTGGEANPPVYVPPPQEP